MLSCFSKFHAFKLSTKIYLLYPMKHVGSVHFLRDMHIFCKMKEVSSLRFFKHTLNKDMDWSFMVEFLGGLEVAFGNE